jgi:gliding motility-associated-like protein
VVTPGDIVPVGGEINITVIAQPSFGPNTTYEWFIEGNSQGQGGPIFTTNQDIEGPTLYRVLIVDDNGCFWEGIVTVTGSVPEFKLPNAFTPFNNDDVNKVFRLVQTDLGKLDNWELNSFDIFNRWGEKVFSCEDKQCALEEGWNGRINNSNAPAGVYIYGIELELGNGDKISFRGDVTLLR